MLVSTTNFWNRHNKHCNILSCSVNFYFREITYIMFKLFHLVYLFLCTFTLYYFTLIIITWLWFCIFCLYIVFICWRQRACMVQSKCYCLKFPVFLYKMNLQVICLIGHEHLWKQAIFDFSVTLSKSNIIIHNLSWQHKI